MSGYFRYRPVTLSSSFRQCSGESSSLASGPTDCSTGARAKSSTGWSTLYCLSMACFAVSASLADLYAWSVTSHICCRTAGRAEKPHVKLLVLAQTPKRRLRRITFHLAQAVLDVIGCLNLIHLQARPGALELREHRVQKWIALRGGPPRGSYCGGGCAGLRLYLQRARQAGNHPEGYH